MDCLSKKQAESECGPANAILPSEIKDILDNIKINKSDVFYDLGSGHGRFVRTVVKNTKAKKAKGIESDVNRFCKSIRMAKKTLTKSQKKRVEFICSEFEKFNFSDATIIYEGHEEDCMEVPLYQKTLKNKTKIIKMDLPLVGYKPLKVIENTNRRFYIMQFPLENMKHQRIKWCSFVNKENPTFKGVTDYYRKVLYENNIEKNEINNSIRRLRRLFNKRL